MKQKDKDLLLKDLCARLPYNVKLKITSYEDIDEFESVGTLRQLNKQYFWILEDEFERCIEYNKPFLFPLSSMTEEQEEELEEMGLGFYRSGEIMTEDGRIIYGSKTFQLIPCTETDDWLLEHHFDHRDLLKKGLAIDATGLSIY